MNIGEGGSNSQDFDLQIAPIIDAFTVLIAFMIASASFISIGILDAGISAGGATKSKAKAPPVTVTVKLKSKHRLEVLVQNSNGKKMAGSTVFRGKNDSYDVKALSEHLKQVKGTWSKPSAPLSGMTLAAEDRIPYQEVIRVMNRSRKVLPAIVLGGF